MPLPIEGDSRVSEALAARMEAMLDDPDIQEPVTLGFVRNRLREALTDRGVKADRSQFGTEESLYAEIEALVEEFGAEAPAADFTAVKASEDLSEVIESILDDSDSEVAKTLGDVRDAITGGVFPRLVGEGVVEDEQYETLLAEIDALIGRYGRDTLAEQMLRFE